MERLANVIDKCVNFQSNEEHVESCIARVLPWDSDEASRISHHFE